MGANYNFDPGHLRIPELNYELRIRNVSADRVDNTLKRKYLRRELKKDLSRPDVQYATPNFDIDFEKQELDVSIASVTQLVDDYDGINEEVGQRLRSRICHILGRLSRIPVNIGDEASHYRGDNIIRVTTLLEDLDDIADRIRQGNVVGAVNTVQGGPRVTNITAKAIPVYKWNIIFDGNTSKTSLSSFLQRIEELRQARNCSTEELFQSASDLFEGVAREWFRSQLRQNRFNSWHTLVTALRQDFLPADYDDQLRKEIEQRTQGQSEKVVIYISIMENLFNCLGNPPSEEEKLKIIRRNLQPFFHPHLALQNISDISTLTTTCRSLEEANMLKKKFQPPPRNVSVLEPDLAYNPQPEGSSNPHSSKSCTVPQRQPSKRNKYEATPRAWETRQVAAVQCWRCKESGHIQRDCKKKLPSCHGCGKLNVIRPNCPDCSKNGSRGNV